MSNDTAESKPVAISFKDFRDEEIVGFFANEHRTFRAESCSPSNSDFGRSRIVGAVQPPSSPRPTAAFRTALQAKARAEKNRRGPLQKEFAKTIPLPVDVGGVDPSIRQATMESIPDRPKTKRKSVSEPLFGKPPRPLGSVLLSNQKKSTDQGRAARIVLDPVKPADSSSKTILKSPHFEGKWSRADQEHQKERREEKSPKSTDPVIARITETDTKLRLLVQSWPRLSSQLKETITALIEVTEKDAP